MNDHSVPQRGDIVTVPALPGRRYLVISPETFNALGMCLAAPIVQASECRRYAGFTSPMAMNEDGHDTVILISHIQPLSLTGQAVQLQSKAHLASFDDLLARLQTLVGPISE